MGPLRIGQVNLVLADVEGAAAFLAGLGVELDEVSAEWAEWAAHHQSAAGTQEMVVDLDSSDFARWWGGVPDGFTGVVLGLRVEERADVDRVFARALELGAEALCAPHDAFWGSRFATVAAPGPLVVGLLSDIDPTHRSAPPALTDLG